VLTWAQMLHSRLTALCLGDLNVQQPCEEGHEFIAALVQALLQLHELRFMYFAALATDAGSQCRAPQRLHEIVCSPHHRFACLYVQSKPYEASQETP
jgi:hypothetical protein